MYGLILTLHIIICTVLIIVILIQTGQVGMGGLFGGGSKESLFSAPSGTAFIRKVTVGFAIGFLCTTILLTILQSRKMSRSVIERVGIPQPQNQ